MTTHTFAELEKRLISAAYFGDLYGLRRLLDSVPPASLGQERVETLLMSAQAGDSPFYPRIEALLLKTCVAEETHRIQLPAPSPLRPLSPAQEAMLRRCEPLRMPCAPFLVGERLTQEGPKEAYFGGQPFMLDEEVWPSFEGVPMTFVCHLSLDSAPVVDPRMRHNTAFSLFMHTEEPPGQECGEGWYLRGYDEEDVGKLRLRQPPSAADLLPDCWSVSWQPTTLEWPHPSDERCNAIDVADLEAEHAQFIAGRLEPTSHSEADDDDDDDLTPLQQALSDAPAQACCKLFGNPYLLQAGSDFRYSQVLQLIPVPEIGLHLHAGGFASFGVWTPDEGPRCWICDFQYY